MGPLPVILFMHKKVFSKTQDILYAGLENIKKGEMKMKENKKHIILVLGLAAVIAVATAVLTCVLLMPKLMLGRRLNEILKDTYTYNAEASVAGVDMGILGDEFEGSITGSRSNDVIYGNVSYNGFECLEIYVENDGKVMLNIEKLFESAVNKAEEKTGLPLDFIRNKLTDLTISSSQIEDITGERFVTMADAGVTHNTLEEFVQAVKLLSSFKQVKADDIAAEYMLLGDDARYFMLELKDGMTKVYIGVPKDKNDKTTSFVVEYMGSGVADGADAIVWKIKLDYEVGEVGEIDVPDETLPKETIELLKKVYGYLE